MNEEIESWLEIAKYDLKTAKVCLKEELYLKVYENSHAALEKVLKGIIQQSTNQNPPKIHNLLKLASMVLVDELEKEIKSTLD